jgi:DNA-binding MarR family transcriptional regulator
MKKRKKMKPIDLLGAQARFEKAYVAAHEIENGVDYDLMYIRQVFLGMGRFFGLSPTESLLMSLVHTFSKDGKGWCFMGLKGLASALNVSPQTIASSLEKLEKIELLEESPTSHPRWRTNQWRLAPRALDRLRYLQKRINQKMKSKGSYQNHDQ